MVWLPTKNYSETRVENWVSIGAGHLNIGSISFSFGMEMRAVLTS